MGLADNVPNSECYTAKELCSELDISMARLRQILAEAKKSGKVQFIVKKDGAKILYTPQMVEQLKAWRGKTNTRSSGNNRKRSLTSAKFVVQVPVYDPEIANLLKARFKTDEDMSKFLQAKLEETVKPKLNKLRELELEFERQKKELMYETT